MRKALGCTILSATLTCGLAMPAAAIPTADGPGGAQQAPLAASALSPAAAAKLTPALALGARTPAVVYVQQKLGINPASGYYGTLTRAAVIALQRQSKLKATGTVDKATWKVLLSASATSPAVAATSPKAAAKLRPVLVLGARTPAVVYVQQKLGVAPASGYYGELTRAAVIALQEQSGLKSSGTVDKATWKVLLSAEGVIALPAADSSATSSEDPPADPPAAAAAPAAPAAPAADAAPPASDPATPATPADPATKPPADPVAPAAPAAPAAPSTPTTPTTPTPPATLTPEEAAAARPLLKLGKGPGNPAVVFVQQYLGISPATGYFGTKTRKAVRAYQRALGFTPTGKVGPITWKALAAGRTAANPTGTAAPAVPVDPSAPAPVASVPVASVPVASVPVAAVPAAPPPTPAPATITTPTYVLPANPAARDLALVYALAQVGKPYVLGGNGPAVYDCSGLVQQAYLAAGVRLPRLASLQRFAGTEVSIEELLPGDLLYYQDGSSPRRGHISMYAGDGLVVEAANPRRGVRIRTLHEAWYRDRFVAAIRIG